jgi:hypothetical protein
MARDDVLRPYLEKILSEISGASDLRAAPDGSYGFRAGSAGLRVRLVSGDPPVVKVFSVMLRNVPMSNKLLQRLNEINSGIRFGRMFWAKRVVVVASELVAETLDAKELDNACVMIGTLADHFDTELEKEFGGEKLGQDQDFDSVDL